MATEIVIDIKGCDNSEKVLRKIAEVLKFADWFGFNWDALEECVRCLNETSNLKEGVKPYNFPLKLIFTNVKDFKNHPKFHILVDILKDAKKLYKKNNLKFDFELRN